MLKRLALTPPASRRSLASRMTSPRLKGDGSSGGVCAVTAVGQVVAHRQEKRNSKTSGTLHDNHRVLHIRRAGPARRCRPGGGSRFVTSQLPCVRGPRPACEFLWPPHDPVARIDRNAPPFQDRQRGSLDSMKLGFFPIRFVPPPRVRRPRLRTWRRPPRSASAASCGPPACWPSR